MSMKEAYEKKLQGKLDELSAEIDKLKAKADSAEADAKLEYYKQIDELRAMHDAASKKLDELREAGDNAWEDLKAGIESALDSLSSSIKSAVSRQLKRDTAEVDEVVESFKTFLLLHPKDKQQQYENHLESDRAGAMAEAVVFSFLRKSFDTNIIEGLFPLHLLLPMIFRVFMGYHPPLRIASSGRA